MLQSATSSPLFFYNPFAAPKLAEGESENVSIYTTTTQPSSDGRAVTQPPTVYQQIARNVLERIASPVVSHFILVTATEKSAKIISTTSRPKESSNQLEIVEDAVTESDEISNTTNAIDVMEGTEDREDINPIYIRSNPSFNRTARRNDRPERLTLYPGLDPAEEEESVATEVKKENNQASEVKDLNMITGDFFDTISDLPDDDNEVDTDREQVDPDLIKVITTEETKNFNEVTTEDSDEDDFPVTTSRPGFKKNFSESGVIYVFELFGSLYSLLTGIFQALFNRNTMADMTP